VPTSIARDPERLGNRLDKPLSELRTSALSGMNSWRAHFGVLPQNCSFAGGRFPTLSGGAVIQTGLLRSMATVRRSAVARLGTVSGGHRPNPPFGEIELNGRCRDQEEVCIPSDA
jgi:hypothetical protein